MVPSFGWKLTHPGNNSWNNSGYNAMSVLFDSLNTKGASSDSDEDS